jgi:hypothetical protein
MELKNNQSALILEASDDGEITVDMVSPDRHGFTAKLCVAIAKKIMQDETFQTELMDMVEEE